MSLTGVIATALPIESVLPDLKDALRSHHSAVLVAPPGAGKTTRVPLALRDEPWLAGRRMLMLEPRRLAARTVARYMASALGEPVGGTVGFRVRADTRVGPGTRLEVITEGVLTRLLQADPALEGVGLVIFDEFHERSLHADLGLALCLQTRALLREDLRILVMSATLDAEPVTALLDGGPVIATQGRSFPVTTHFRPQRMVGPLELTVAATILEAMTSAAGNILVFLPGAREIRRVAAQLAARGLPPQVRVTVLHGDLPHAAQDQAIAPGAPEERKIVLATAIAETSLTVAGVGVVVDSGLMRVPRFSPRTGMTRLETVPVSRASADQRRGRAGRLGPGVCFRLWTEAEDRRLVPHNTPEILEADLAPLALELAVWGTPDPAELRWLDPPPAAALAQARDLLGQLGALDAAGAVTPHGRRMAALGLHPRLAHMILRAIPLGHGALACDLAALLSERDILKGDGAGPNADLRLRVAALQQTGAATVSVDPGAATRVRHEAQRWRHSQGVASAARSDPAACGLLLAFAYPDRIAQRRADGRFLLRNGRGAAFTTVQPLAAAPYLVAADLDDRGAESRIFLAAPVEMSELEQHCADQIEVETTVAWDPAAQAVRARRRRRLGAPVLQDDPLPDPESERVVAALLQGIAAEGLTLLPWSGPARQLQQRLLFIWQLGSGWPDVSDVTLAATLPDWLAPHLVGLRSRADLQRLDVTAILAGTLSPAQRRQLDEWAPTHILVPSGSRIAIDYSDPAAPVLAVRLQELFGLTETPRIASGSVPLTLHLLSPAHRPVQVTRDLASFWRTAYFEVRKDLRGRYPKHFWPDDPLAAPPTRRTRPRP